MTYGIASRFLLASVSAAAVLCACPAVRADVPGVAALLAQGRYWQAKGRSDLAAQAFRRALALDPANSTARQALTAPPAPAFTSPQASDSRIRPARPAPRPAQGAVARGAARAAGFQALKANDLGQAAKLFQRAVAQDGRDADALGGLGIVRLKQGLFAEARNLLERATQLGNSAKWADALASARFFAGLADARAVLAQGHLADAQAKTEALVGSNYADRTPALELLANIYEREGRYADAASIFRQAGPNNEASQSRLMGRADRDRALQASANGDAAGAEAAFQSGLLKDQSDPWIRYEFARFLLAQGRRPEAEALAGTLAMGNDPDWRYAGALIDSALGHPETASSLMSSISPGQRTPEMRDFAIGLKIDIAVARARLLTTQGRQAEALPTLRELADTPGLAPAKLAEIADALAEAGDSDAATLLAQRALDGQISDPQDYEPIVHVFVKAGRDAEADAALQRAAQLAGPTVQGQKIVAHLNSIVAVERADKLRLAGQYASAFDLLHATWTTESGQNNADVLAALARLYQSGGMAPQAAQTFQMVLTKSPRDKGALIGLIETAGAAGDVSLARATINQALTSTPDDYEIYLAAARMEQARGDKGAALKYLKRARQLYTDRSQPSEAFSANPFAVAQSDNPFRQFSPPAPPAPVNPFMLGNHIPSPTPVLAMSEPMQNGAMRNGAMPQGGWRDTVPIDPVLAGIQADIHTLANDSRPREDIQAGYRYREGETGLSALNELTATAQSSIGLGSGRLAARASAVVLDSGQPSGSALARFGRNATPEAQGIVAKLPSKLSPAPTQHQAGVAVSLAYDGPLIQADVGSTPLGFKKTAVTWHAGLSPRLSSTTTARIWAEQRPVTDSVLAYAGTRDPVIGSFWGRVMRMGGGASLSYDHDGSGVYADGSYSRYTGVKTPENYGIQANIGAYAPLWHAGHSSLTGGFNFDYQKFGNNQNFFTFGQGGYFSPQNFYGGSFPLRYAFTNDRLEIRANVAPGFQSYYQAQEPVYPTDPAAQALLTALKLKDTDVRSYYDSISKTGFAISADGSVYYKLGPQTRVGGEFGINTFGNYTEFKSLLGIRETFNGAP